jgi:hypothetical protein
MVVEVSDDVVQHLERRYRRVAWAVLLAIALCVIALVAGIVVVRAGSHATVDRAPVVQYRCVPGHGHAC